MSQYTIKLWFAPHEGGTKFYKVYAITHASRAVLVTHWGSYSGVDYFPKEHGQRKIKDTIAGTVEWDADKVKKAKNGRGYSFEGPLTEVFHRDGIELKKRLDKMFTPNDILGILAHLKGGSDGLKLPEVSDDELPEIELPEPRPITEPERGEDWGSW